MFYALKLYVSCFLMSLVRGVEDLQSSSSSLHYNFDHSYGYADHHSPFIGYEHKHGHHYTDIGSKFINQLIKKEFIWDTDGIPINSYYE